MDTTEDLGDPSVDALSYDDTIEYAEQITSATGPALADRISRNKVYLLADSSTGRSVKRKRGDDDEGEPSGHVEAEHNDYEDAERYSPEHDPSTRRNALLFQGTPISHLPTDSIFKYATHFKAHPLGLEWVDDTTCVLVFESDEAAQKAHSLLQKTQNDIPDEEDFLHARSIPMALWPPEDRINASLGKGDGLRGTIRMRWAQAGDVKKKGARGASEFYKKHGMDAGKDAAHKKPDLGDRISGNGRQSKRRRTDGDDTTPTLAELDEQLDSFLREESPEEIQEPSKMRSDSMIDGHNQRSLLQRTSIMREHPVRLFDRMSSSPRRRSSPREQEIRAERPRNRGNRSDPRPAKSQKELDDELDAFLNDRE